MFQERFFVFLSSSSYHIRQGSHKAPFGVVLTLLFFGGFVVLSVCTTGLVSIGRTITLRRGFGLWTPHGQTHLGRDPKRAENAF